jgi:hypothetical protein
MPPPCHDASDSNPVHIKLADYGMYSDHAVIFGSFVWQMCFKLVCIVMLHYWMSDSWHSHETARAIYAATQHHIPEDLNPHHCLCKNLKSGSGRYVTSFVLLFLCYRNKPINLTIRNKGFWWHWRVHGSWNYAIQWWRGIHRKGKIKFLHGKWYSSTIAHVTLSVRILMSGELNVTIKSFLSAFPKFIIYNHSYTTIFIHQ